MSPLHSLITFINQSYLFQYYIMTLKYQEFKGRWLICDLDFLLCAYSDSSVPSEYAQSYLLGYWIRLKYVGVGENEN